ncbi:Hsp70 family protein [Thermogutta terrifontis]|uniref:Hsp70 family protein n=1 Tax=Thermogutta terrifontis TaxID=1331910 RepID=UPI000BA8B521|nr:Hsp70 family protein [Thermogutta terrifontis]
MTISGERIPAVGIDLGTTYSVVAYLDAQGHPETIVNAEGERLTPSVVYFDGEEVIVGREALKAFARLPSQAAECSKRDVGYKVYHKALQGKYYPPEVIEAFILNKLRQDAAQQLGEFSHVVITVPAYFDEVRRKATQDAGYMAGLEVMDIINEPVAAALAFGYESGKLNTPSSDIKPERVLVYDLGGGTFDVTVMEIRGYEYVTLSIDGDVRLGGWDWDQRLVDLVAEKIIRQIGFDPREDVRLWGKLWSACEEAKRTLSVRTKTVIPFEYRTKTVDVEVRREEFEEATRDLLDRTRFTTLQALKAAGLDWGDIDRVLLVGGSTRMPMVRNLIRELSGKEPDTSISADEAVALGAALHAGWLLGKARGERPRYKVRNVNSHSLGVVGWDPLTRRRRVGTIIPRNTRLPIIAKRRFRTHKSDQRSILVEIVEGESPEPEDCCQIGKVRVHDLPPNLPKGWPVEVIFQYRANGRLKVRIRVPEVDREVVAEFQRERALTKEHLDGWRRFISGKEPTDYR